MEIVTIADLGVYLTEHGLTITAGRLRGKHGRWVVALARIDGPSHRFVGEGDTLIVALVAALADHAKAVK